MKKCVKCGVLNPNESRFCSNCGSNQFEMDQVKQTDDEKDYYRAKIIELKSNQKKKKQNIWMYLIGFLLLPLVPYYLIYNSRKVERKQKPYYYLGYSVVLLFLVIMLPKSVPVESITISESKSELSKDETALVEISFLPENSSESDSITCVSSDPNIARIDNYKVVGVNEGTVSVTCNYSDVKSNTINIVVKFTEEQKIANAKEQVKARFKSTGYELLVDKGINLDMIVSLDTIKSQMDFGKLVSVGDPVTLNGVTTLPVDTESLQIRVSFKDNAVNSVVDNKGVTIYGNGKLNENYYIWDSITSPIFFRDNAIKFIKSNLKAPASAKFPGSVWDGYNNWTFGAKNNVVSVASYVDAQNSFGALIRSQFIIQYTQNAGLWTVTYLYFDGTETGKFVK